MLARALAPADFGVFASATFVVGVLALVADLGLKPALIQRLRRADAPTLGGWWAVRVCVSQ